MRELADDVTMRRMIFASFASFADIDSFLNLRLLAFIRG